MRPSLVEVEGSVSTGLLDRQGMVTSAFELYHGELYSFLRRSTRDEAAAEDLLQEAFLRLASEADAGRAPDNVRGWLYRVASNLAISRGRRRTVAFAWMDRYGRQASEGTEESPEAQVLARERTSAIDGVLATLPVEARTALLLAAEGFRGEEIAALIGRSDAATRTLLSRTRVRVRLELESQGDVR